MANIKIDKNTGFAYIPKELREQGFEGEVNFVDNALTVTLIKPGVPLERAIKSLEIVIKDLELRIEHEKETQGEDKESSQQ
ncbi:hypothetical protein ES705_17604 [subsurface metagenome]